MPEGSGQASPNGNLLTVEEFGHTTSFVNGSVVLDKNEVLRQVTPGKGQEAVLDDTDVLFSRHTALQQNQWSRSIRCHGAPNHDGAAASLQSANCASRCEFFTDTAPYVSPTIAAESIELRLVSEDGPVPCRRCPLQVSASEGQAVAAILG